MSKLYLEYQYSGSNACQGIRFETAVRNYAENHQTELARLKSADKIAAGEERDLTPEEIRELNAAQSVIEDGILTEGGYEDSDTVALHIRDLCWEVRRITCCVSTLT